MNEDIPAGRRSVIGDGKMTERILCVIVLLLEIRAVPPRTLPSDLHGKLHSRGKASHRESDLAAGSHYALLRPDHAVTELEEKGGRAVSVFQDS